MARATVEIEMPDCCAACPLMHEYECGPMQEQVTTDLWVKREKWCPLKEPAIAWTSVKNALPETDRRVLVLDNNWNVFDAYYEGNMFDEKERFGEWRAVFDTDAAWITGKEWEPYEGIMYWMEIPEFPAGDRNETEDEDDEC